MTLTAVLNNFSGNYQRNVIDYWWNVEGIIKHSWKTSKIMRKLWVSAGNYSWDEPYRYGETEVAGRKPADDVIWYNTDVWDRLSPFASYFTSFKDYPNSQCHLCLSWCKGSHNTTGKKRIFIIGLTFQERNVLSEFNKKHLKNGKMQKCAWSEHIWPYRNESKREIQFPEVEVIKHLQVGWAPSLLPSLKIIQHGWSRIMAQHAQGTVWF